MKDIDPQGAENLVRGIVSRAKIDFMKSKPDSEVHKETVRFFRSAYFEMLTGLDGEAFLHDLNKQYEKKHKKNKGA